MHEEINKSVRHQVLVAVRAFTLQMLYAKYKHFLAFKSKIFTPLELVKVKYCKKIYNPATCNFTCRIAPIAE